MDVVVSRERGFIKYFQISKATMLSADSESLKLIRMDFRRAKWSVKSSKSSRFLFKSAAFVTYREESWGRRCAAGSSISGGGICFGAGNSKGGTVVFCFLLDGLGDLAKIRLLDGSGGRMESHVVVDVVSCRRGLICNLYLVVTLGCGFN